MSAIRRTVCTIAIALCSAAAGLAHAGGPVRGSMNLAEPTDPTEPTEFARERELAARLAEERCREAEFKLEACRERSDACENLREIAYETELAARALEPVLVEY